jgi:transketolase N-terminal domain/subunit
MTKAQTKAVTSPAPSVRDMANAIRALAMDAVQAANSGHPGMPMGMADVATVLFTEALKFDPAVPGWANRDRFVLSAGHGSMLLYALLHLTGYPGMTIEELKSVRLQDGRTSGIWPCARHRDDHRSARAGPRQRRRHRAVGALACGARRQRSHRLPYLRDRR